MLRRPFVCRAALARTRAAAARAASRRTPATRSRSPAATSPTTPGSTAVAFTRCAPVAPPLTHQCIAKYHRMVVCSKFKDYHHLPVDGDTPECLRIKVVHQCPSNLTMWLGDAGLGKQRHRPQVCPARQHRPEQRRRHLCRQSQHGQLHRPAASEQCCASRCGRVSRRAISLLHCPCSASTPHVLERCMHRKPVNTTLFKLLWSLRSQSAKHDFREGHSCQS